MPAAQYSLTNSSESWFKTLIIYIYILHQFIPFIQFIIYTNITDEFEGHNLASEARCQPASDACTKAVDGRFRPVSGIPVRQASFGLRLVFSHMVFVRRVVLWHVLRVASRNCRKYAVRFHDGHVVNADKFQVS